MRLVVDAIRENPEEGHELVACAKSPLIPMILADRTGDGTGRWCWPV